MIWDMIPRCISRYDVTPDHLETPGKYKFNENPPPRCVLLLFFSALSLPSSWLALWAFSSSFCCPSDGHIIGLTVPPANSNLVPSGLGLLPEHLRLFLFHFSSFLYFSFFTCLFSFFIPGTWYSLVVARYLICYCC